MTADYKHAAAAVPASTTGTTSRYRDEPDAVSMHTTRSDYEYDDVPQLPSYDESVSGDSSTRPNDAHDYADPPPLDEYRVIAPPDNNWRGRSKGVSPTKAVGSETSIRMEDRLLDARTLEGYIRTYLSLLPPRPVVRIQGWHWKTKKKDNKKEQERVYDFDIVMSLQAYLPTSQREEEGFWARNIATNGDKRHRGSVFKVRAKGYKQDIEVGTEEAPDLKAWCEDFCNSKSTLKVFRLSRNVTGMITSEISDRIVPLIRSTHYRGHIDITFPIADRHVDIYNPHWINSARISWVRWIFYLTFLWIFTWPILFFLTKWWTVCDVEFRWSTWAADGMKKFATISEESWVNQHANLIRSLVLEKFHGDGTDMPVNVDVEGRMRRASGEVPQTGNRNVDAAVSFISGSVSAWNTLNGRSTQSGWGADS
ncbi:hypothetical protein M409DRAFT_68760 [Zasmidium cellare ATCC 36951]|uniref:Uncharacterized protein n=1 Tax=Zasmidium cellare ATCC 36951 TaxID=1080233 RepID=A0A6A6C7Z0_ZASCE|nr:uncharacterized protein M409DRAFT_68760 [Zasmidium cellare ATCC 36951]KAF2163165.1 hypothetical protein M409DRAFT_68760 [Zasmidium cellare ATCC 36951]